MQDVAATRVERRERQVRVGDEPDRCPRCASTGVTYKLRFASSRPVVAMSVEVEAHLSEAPARELWSLCGDCGHQWAATRG